MPRSLILPPLMRSLGWLLVSMLSLQGGSGAAKELIGSSGVWNAAALRTSLAFLVLLLFFRVSVWRIWREHAVLVVPYGLLLGLMNLTFYASLQFLPLGMAVTLEFVGPLGLSLWLSRKPSHLAWVLLAGMGVWLMLPLGQAGGNWLGVGLALLAGLWWALYIVTGATVAAHLSSEEGITAGMGIAAVVCGIGWLLASMNGATGHLTGQALGLGLMVAIFSSALPYALELRALGSVPPQLFGIFMSLEPAIAALIGLIFLGEAMSLRGWLAIALVVLASTGVSRDTQTEKS